MSDQGKVLSRNVSRYTCRYLFFIVDRGALAANRGKAFLDDFDVLWW